MMRYPLKSAGGERLQSVDVEPEGLRLDTAWACLDLVDGTLGSAKHPRRWERLLEVSAQVDNQADCVIGVAGRKALAGSEEANAVLSRHLGRIRLGRRW